MRILFCSQAAHTGGGVEAWLEALSAALAARGWDVVTGLAKGRFHDPVRYAARHRVIEPVAIDGSSGLREDRMLELRRLFDRVQPDVILPVNLADALYAASYWKRARVAVCVHGQGDDRLDQVRDCAPFLDLAASVAKRVADRLAALIEPERVHHIPTGVAPPLRGTPPRDRLQQIAYVGRLDSDKRVRDAIPLIRLLHDLEVTFHFVGTGPEEAHLRDAFREERRVVFHGDVPHDELYSSIYPSIDAIAVFSEAETGPIVAWEAMIHGVVPVISDYAGRSEENVIRDGATGLVFPVGDMAEAAKQIRAAAAPGALRELSYRARTELPPSYTRAAFEQSWHEALLRCLEMPVKRGARSALPPLVSPGLVSRLGLSLEATSRLRRLLGRRYEHGDPGSEWPH